MRSLVTTLPALVLPATQRPDPASQRLGATAAPGLLADVAGLASDVECRFLALEAHCAELRTVPPQDPEIRRLDALLAEAVKALADAPARDLSGLIAKAHALTRCPAIMEDDARSETVGQSLGRDVLRLLGAPQLSQVYHGD